MSATDRPRTTLRGDSVSLTESPRLLPQLPTGKEWWYRGDREPGALSDPIIVPSITKI